MTEAIQAVLSCIVVVGGLTHLALISGTDECATSSNLGTYVFRLRTGP